MADTRTPPPPTPASWGEAFAALPAETPPRDGWQRVARQLDARRRRHAPAWFGVAAAAGVVLAVGVWTLRPGPEPALPAADPAPVTAAQPAPESAGAVVEIATSPAPDTATPTASSPSPSAAPARATATQRPGGADTPPEAATDAAQDTALASLQRESAQLEGLLALARDDSVGSAGAVLLADAFDARLAGIDALLANS